MPVGWSDFAQSLVLLLCLLPLAGAVLVALVSRWGNSAVRQMALASVLLSCGLSVLMVPHMQAAGPRYRMVSVHRWLAGERLAERQPPGPTADRSAAQRPRTIGPDIRLAVGVDSVSLWPIVLTSLLMVPVVLLGEKHERNQPALFYGSLLIFQSAATGLFAALDVVLFCFCFELTILPLCLLIGHWGGSQRRPVVRRLFVNHLVGSLFVLLGLTGVVVTYWWMRSDALGTVPLLTFSIPQLLNGNGTVPGLAMLAATNGVAGFVWNQFGPWLFLLLLVGFLVRPALFPFHTALPTVVREAPVVARVLLIGVVPLFSLYGCVRFLLPMFPAQCAELGRTISTIAIVGLVFTGLLALAETDAVKRITLAAVGLFELSLAGIFLQTPLGVTGGLVQMLSAGLSFGLLLEVHNRPGQINATAGKPGRSQPRRRALLLFAVLAVIGAPGLSGFSGATLSLLGIFQQSGRLAISALVGLLIVAWGVLWLWPTDLSPRNAILPEGGAEDLTVRDCAAITPIVVAIIWMGVNPQLIADHIQPAFERGRPAAAFGVPIRRAGRRIVWPGLEDEIRSPGVSFASLRPPPSTPEFRNGTPRQSRAEDWIAAGAESYNDKSRIGTLRTGRSCLFRPPEDVQWGSQCFGPSSCPHGSAVWSGWPVSPFSTESRPLRTSRLRKRSPAINRSISCETSDRF